MGALCTPPANDVLKMCWWSSSRNLDLFWGLDWLFPPRPTASKPKVYSYNAVISSCQNGSQWQLALLFYEAMDGVS